MIHLLILLAATVQGRIVDLVREKPLGNTTVTVVETGATATSDKNGNFSVELGPGNWTLRAGKPPYEPIDVTVTVAEQGRPEPVQIGLFDRVESVQVFELVPREKPSPGATQIVREEITVVPGSRGDALAAVQSLPGVAQTGTFSLAGGLVIRGSAPQDSRVFVDGIEVPFLFHFFNLQSIFPTEMIDDIVYAPGGFGVEHGRASAGIIEMRSRRPKPEWHGMAEISFINAAAFLQGPLLGSSHTSKYDPTFAVAFRRSFMDAIIPAILPADADLSFTALPRYYDYQARLDWMVSDRWRLGFFLFGTDDLFELTSGTDSAEDPSLTGATFRNATSFLRAIASATYESERVTSRTSVTGMGGNFIFEAREDRYLRFDAKGASFRNETKVRIVPRLSLRTGAEAEQWFLEGHVKFPRPPREGDPQNPNFTFDPPVVFDSNYPFTYLGAWLAMDIDVTSRLTLSPGIRYDGYLRSYDHVAEPRGEAKFKLNQSTSLRASGGLYTRPPDYNDEQIQRELDPEKSWQATVGVEHQPWRWLTVQTTGFYTWRSDLIVWDTNRNDPSMTERAYVNAGTGRTYGGELFVQGRGARAFGWVAYTLSRSVRRDHPGQDQRLFDFDQTHNLIALGSWTFGKNQRWRIGGRFQFTSGKPYTPVRGSVFQSDLNYYSPEFGAVNSQRFAPLHQLDLRLDRVWKFQRWRLSAYLDVTNIYAHPAPLQQQYSYDYSETQAINGIPILPSIGIKGEF